MAQLKTNVRKAENNLKNLRDPLFLIADVLLIILVVSFAFSQFSEPINNIRPTPMPTQTSNPTPTPTNTPNPTSTPIQTPKPAPTPTPTNQGHIYITGITIFGGDLQGNNIQLNTLYLGESMNVSFYARSTSYRPITLTYLINDWSPPGLGSYLWLTWNYNGLPINPNQTIMLTLTLSAPYSDAFANYLITNNITTYGFNLNIYYTQQ
jgi:hypothetical protein